MVKRLVVTGLHDRGDITIPFADRASVFIGPNGIGKSTIISIFVFMLSRQWTRLSRQPFSTAHIEFESGETITVSQSDCADVASMDLGIRNQALAQVMLEEGLIERLLEDDSALEVLPKLIEHRIPAEVRDLRILRNYIFSLGAEAVRSLVSISKVSVVVRKNFTQKIIYLPTYRRIEQDLTQLMAMKPSTLRRISEELDDYVSHQGQSYVELVRFGMDDITQLIEKVTSDIKEFSREQISSLSTRFLVSILESNTKFDRRFFQTLSDERIESILSRIDDRQLDYFQRSDLAALIGNLRNRAGAGRLAKIEESAAIYFRLLTAAHESIEVREIDLKRLAEILNRYFGTSKKADYDPSRFEFTIRVGEKDIPLSGLSSGEKQIVSLFATLLLNESENMFIIIDEPELSLSVLWQEMLLDDLLSLQSCQYLIAATHSPFIYGEQYARITRDLSDFFLPEWKYA
jgi:predicted ATPase/gas vesicle protein